MTWKIIVECENEKDCRKIRNYIDGIRYSKIKIKNPFTIEVISDE